MPGRLEFDFTFNQPRDGPSARRRADGAMRILLMGDFSGRGPDASSDELASRSILPVDIDNFNETMARIGPRLRLPLGEESGPGMEINFSQLDDFHPDELYQKLGLFQELRSLRARLMDPATFPQAAAELRHEALQPEQAAEPAAAEADSESALAEDDDSMFERLLGRQHVDSAQTPTGGPRSESQAAIHQLIQGIVGPHIVPEADPLQPQYVAAVDDAVSGQMRAVLHHPRFQALEALWRSLYGLVAGLETGQDLKLCLLDVSRNELAEDIGAAQGRLDESGLYRLLVEKGVGSLGGEGWSLLVGNYTFTTDADDLSLLAALGAIASQAGGPFLAAADAAMLGCRSLVETPDPRDWKVEDTQAQQDWQALRQSAVAPWIGLAHPRILLRLPYGKHSDALDYFEFEEIGQQREHESYLWGNPAFACAMLIATAYQASGWSMEPGDCLDIEDLPAHVFDDEGERQMMACAEVFLTERAASAVLDRGLMPLISYRNRNAVRLMRFQSIAEPGKALAGPWA